MVFSLFKMKSVAGFILVAIVCITNIECNCADRWYGCWDYTLNTYGEVCAPACYQSFNGCPFCAKFESEYMIWCRNYVSPSTDRWEQKSGQTCSSRFAVQRLQKIKGFLFNSLNQTRSVIDG